MKQIKHLRTSKKGKIFEAGGLEGLIDLKIMEMDWKNVNDFKKIKEVIKEDKLEFISIKLNFLVLKDFLKFKYNLEEREITKTTAKMAISSYLLDRNIEWENDRNNNFNFKVKVKK